MMGRTARAVVTAGECMWNDIKLESSKASSTEGNQLPQTKEAKQAASSSFKNCWEEPCHTQRHVIVDRA